MEVLTSPKPLQNSPDEHPQECLNDAQRSSPFEKLIELVELVDRSSRPCEQVMPTEPARNVKLPTSKGALCDLPPSTKWPPCATPTGDQRFPDRVYQQVTAVARPWCDRDWPRRQGRMLNLVRERHSEVQTAITHNAHANPSMLSINRQLGFAVHREEGTYVPAQLLVGTNSAGRCIYRHRTAARLDIDCMGQYRPRTV